MRLRGILIISLGLNLALAAGWYFAAREPAASGPAASPAAGLDADSNAIVKTNVVVRRQYFSWQEVESADYPTYIANLRDIGCPEPTIRDIIVADVNQLYARRAAEVQTSEQQWWRSSRDAGVDREAAEKLRSLDEERRALLTSLLGPNWDPTAVASTTTSQPRTGIQLTGPVLGSLPAEVKQAVLDISEQAGLRTREYLLDRQEAGKPPDPEMLAKLRQQTRDELAAVLTPPQLEEFLLRYSQNAANLRQELRGFDVSPEEFRELFRARDAIDQQIALHYSGDDPASIQQRELLERQREDAVARALGEERYAIYKVSKDPAFQQAKTTAQRYGSPPEAVLPLYYVNQAVEEEKQRLRNDKTLTAEERVDKLQEVEASHEKSLIGILGEAAYERYQQDRNRQPPLPR